MVLTGINLGSYRAPSDDDLGKDARLEELLGTILSRTGIERVRLSSIEPPDVTDELVAVMAGSGGRIAPFLHVCLQSGCDRTLRAMRRKYDTAAFFEVTERLRRSFPGCALTADLITGFPGETEADQAETLAFIRRCGFADMHVFPYSRRPGTPADKMPEQLSAAVKSRRAAEAAAAAEEMRADYLARQIGQTLEVLFESAAGEGSVGHSDNYLRVRVRGPGLHGQVKNVKITGVSSGELVGNVV